jgi:hypothetical protein
MEIEQLIAQLRTATRRVNAVRMAHDESVDSLVKEIAWAASEGERTSVNGAEYEVARVTWNTWADYSTEPHDDGAVALLRNGALLCDPRPPGYEDWKHFARTPAGASVYELEYDLEFATAEDRAAFMAEAAELVAQLTSLAEEHLAEVRSLELEKAIERVHSLL